MNFLMDYEAKETAVKNFIEERLPQYLIAAELPAVDRFIDDFLDFDKYKANTQIFYDFVNWTFENLTNESNKLNFRMSVYVVLRRADPKTLRTNLLKYASCFYQLFSETGGNFGGIFDHGLLTECNFYNAAEGHRELKVCEIEFEFETEI